jgi:hypothetical protein
MLSALALTALDLRVRASTYGKTPSELLARVQDYTRSERMRRGLRAFAPVFGGACGVLFIPPHIPWFTITTIVAIAIGRRKYNQVREFVSLRGTCPGCGKEDDLKLPDSLPVIQRCVHCGSFLKLEPI